MSPVPIIARQRALSRVGEIRTGGEKPERGAGRKLEAFRLTSQHRDIIDRCATLYGGTPSEWASPNGPAWQLYTEASALTCMVIVGYSLVQVYEHWEGATKCLRRCDGEEDFVSGGPCVCNRDGEDVCDIVTRLMVVLPETGTSLGWQLRSIGEAASRELSGAIDLADGFARGRAFVPATLRLTQRRGVKDGKTVRYVVPVLDFNPLMAAAPALAAGEIPAALPTGYTPLTAPVNGVTVEQGLAGADKGAQPAPRNARSAAPIGPEEDFERHDPVPVPDEGRISGPEPRDERGATPKGADAASTLPPPTGTSSGPDTLIATEAQQILIVTKASKAGLDDDARHALIERVTGQPSSKLVPKALVNDVLAAIASEAA